MPDTIEVFQDLSMEVSDGARTAVRADLIASTTPPWRVDLERSAEIARNNVSTDDLLVFYREEDVLPAAFLTLWANEDGYYVPNIVPTVRSELTRKQYNGLVDDFAQRVLLPVAARHGLLVASTKSEQTLTDWLSADAATRLRRFSLAANKSTGASHPADRRRWFDFIVAVHRTGDGLGADRLARWLHEVDGWDDETAHDLASDYEIALGLLRHYDES